MDIRDVTRTVDGGVEVDIMVSPNAGTQMVDGTNEWRKRIIIRVRSPPLDGRANREVTEFITAMTSCGCEITRGHTNRQKTVTVFGDADEIIRLLEAAL